MSLFLVLFIRVVSLSLIFNACNSTSIFTDCSSFEIESTCSASGSVCVWDIDNSECRFAGNVHVPSLFQIDLIFVTDHTTPTELHNLISYILSSLYENYDYGRHFSLDQHLNCWIRNELVTPCSLLLNSHYVTSVLDSTSEYTILSDHIWQSNRKSVVKSIDDALDILIHNDIDIDNPNPSSKQYIIANLNNEDNYFELCAKLKQLSLFRVYPFLVEWKTFEWQDNFDFLCPFFKEHSEYLQVIKKYERTLLTDLPVISANIANKIYLNSYANPSLFASSNDECLEYSISSQIYGQSSQSSLSSSSSVASMTDEMEYTNGNSQTETLWLYSGIVGSHQNKRYALSRPKTPEKHNENELNHCDEEANKQLQSDLESSNVFQLCFDFNSEKSFAINNPQSVNEKNVYSAELDHWTSDGSLVSIEDSTFTNNNDGCVVSLGFGGSDSNDAVLVVTGGYNEYNGESMMESKLFYSKTNEWIMIPNMNIARYGHSCILIDFVLYVFGGIANSNQINHVDQYLSSIEYIDLKQILNDLDTLNSIESDKMDALQWKLSSSQIQTARISGKLLSVSTFKIFLIGGFGYIDRDLEITGALKSIEIYDIETDECLCSSSNLYNYGLSLIDARASFSTAMYNDEYGYSCLHFIGGRTGSGQLLQSLPLLSSCEKMCFPTNNIDEYIDVIFEDMFTLSYGNGFNGKHSGKSGGAGHGSTVFFERYKWMVWMIVAILIILAILIVLCVSVVSIRRVNRSVNTESNKTGGHGQFVENNQIYIDPYSENTPLLI